MDGDEILVCQAGTCRRAGGEAVLLEIEELAKDGTCSVEASGCLGACSQAPNAAVVRKRRGGETVYTRLVDVEKSAEVGAVFHAALWTVKPHGRGIPIVTGVSTLRVLAPPFDASAQGSRAML